MSYTIEVIARVDGKVHTVVTEGGEMRYEMPLAEPLWQVLLAATHPSWTVVDLTASDR